MVALSALQRCCGFRWQIDLVSARVGISVADLSSCEFISRVGRQVEGKGWWMRCQVGK